MGAHTYRNKIQTSLFASAGVVAALMLMSGLDFKRFIVCFALGILGGAMMSAAFQVLYFHSAINLLLFGILPLAYAVFAIIYCRKKRKSFTFIHAFLVFTAFGAWCYLGAAVTNALLFLRA